MDADTGISNKDMTLIMNQSYFSGRHLLKKTEQQSSVFEIKYRPKKSEDEQEDGPTT